MEQFTSPAVNPNGWLAIGTHIRRMVIIDPATGVVSPTPPLKLNGVIAGTPASFVRQYYVVVARLTCTWSTRTAFW